MMLSTIHRNRSKMKDRPVSRNLFGTMNHQKFSEDLNKEMQNILEEKKRKWNFDFQIDKPVEND
eukprot:Awhi_evm1s13786